MSSLSDVWQRVGEDGCRVSRRPCFCCAYVAAAAMRRPRRNSPAQDFANTDTIPFRSARSTVCMLASPFLIWPSRFAAAAAADAGRRRQPGREPGRELRQGRRRRRRRELGQGRRRQLVQLAGAMAAAAAAAPGAAAPWAAAAWAAPGAGAAVAEAPRLARRHPPRGLRLRPTFGVPTLASND